MGEERKKCREEKLTVKVAWKNVRKIRTREKQMELEEWMKKSDCDVCAINETGLNGNEYVEVGDEHKWIGTNRDWMKGKTGGVGFIIKRSLECERVICESEDVCFLKVGTQAGMYEWLLGSIYMNCEGVRGDENVVKMQRVKDVVRNAKDEGLKIMIGGDMNAHIWELDKCENSNGKLLKNMVNEINLQIMNCVWERMNGPTWFSENSEFTLDYICVDDCALRSVQSAYILGREEVVESDHAAIGVDVEWKVKRKRKARRKMRTTRKRRLAVDKWEEYGSQMEQRDYKDLSSMSVEMTQVGVELNEET